MYEAWERYKDLLKKCPHHELPEWLQIQTFYNGLKNENRAMVDATTWGSLMRMTREDAYGLLDDMAINAFDLQSERKLKRPIGVHSINSQATLAAQMESLQRQLEKMNASSMHHHKVSYEFCCGNHDRMDC